MTGEMAILGAAARVGAGIVADLETELRSVVLSALHKSGLALDDIDAVVTVASDTLDGVMVPIRSEVAGAFSKAPMNVPSSAGHAFAAALVLLESGQARHVLLAGWGAASKLALHDSRDIQADPFHDRPIGANPAAVAVLQASELQAEFPNLPAHSITFADGAVALVLGPAAARGTRIADVGTSSRGYYPEDDAIDPALWVAEATAKWREQPEAALMAVSGPGRTCEARAVAGLARNGGPAKTDAAPGSDAWFGPATALYQIVLLDERLCATGGEGVLVDLAGPMGQHVTCVRLIGGAA